MRWSLIILAFFGAGAATTAEAQYYRYPPPPPPGYYYGPPPGYYQPPPPRRYYRPEPPPGAVSRTTPWDHGQEPWRPRIDPRNGGLYCVQSGYTVQDGICKPGQQFYRRW